jgi:hypothetical protein
MGAFRQLTQRKAPVNDCPLRNRDESATEGSGLGAAPAPGALRSN